MVLTHRSGTPPFTEILFGGGDLEWEGMDGIRHSKQESLIAFGSDTYLKYPDQLASRSRWCLYSKNCVKLADGSASRHP